MSVDIEFLKSIPYFSGLDIAELESIRQLVFERTAQRDEFIVDEGEPGEALYFVASGAVREVKASAEGKEQVLRIIRPGESFNDVPVFDGGPNLASAQAMAPVILYGVSKTDIGVILHDHPQVAANVVKVLAERVRHFASLVEDLSFRNVLSRVAKLLLEYAENGTAPERPHFTQQEMAAMVGTAREMVGRSLRALEEKGAIRIDHHRIVLIDKEALRETVGASL